MSGELTTEFPTLQMIESTSSGNSNWNLLSRVEPNEVFPDRIEDEPLQLRLEVDESGILQTSLRWPGGNRQVPLRLDCETLTESDVTAWKEWLETAMLCSTN